jgi:hypothetical protein
VVVVAAEKEVAVEAAGQEERRSPLALGRFLNARTAQD